jgi:hypothetical protein
MLHTILIAAHTASGLVAFVAGVVAIRRGRLFGVFLWSLFGTILFLVAALAVDWKELGAVQQGVFAALAALGVYMVLRGLQARSVRPIRASRPTADYVDHVGFNLIALFDAFVAVLVLDIGFPVWLVVAVAVLVAIVSSLVLRAIKHQLTAAESEDLSSE